MPNPPATLTPEVRAFLERPMVASIASVDPDGTPRQAVVWYRLEPDGRILVNSRTPRRWCTNLMREPRVALSVVDHHDLYRWVGVTAEVDEVVERRRALAGGHRRARPPLPPRRPRPRAPSPASGASRGSPSCSG